MPNYTNLNDVIYVNTKQNQNNPIICTTVHIPRDIFKTNIATKPTSQNKSETSEI